MKYLKSLLFLIAVFATTTLRADDWSSWKDVPSESSIKYRVSCGSFNSDSDAYQWFIQVKNTANKPVLAKFSFYRKNKKTGDWELTGNNREQHTIDAGGVVKVWCFYPRQDRVEFNIDADFK